MEGESIDSAVLFFSLFLFLICLSSMHCLGLQNFVSVFFAAASLSFIISSIKGLGRNTKCIRSARKLLKNLPYCSLLFQLSFC